MVQEKTPLAEWLIAACAERDLSWAEASRQAGLFPGAVSSIVRGRKPGLDMCKALATFFRVPLDHVLRLAGHTEVASTLASLPPEILVLVHEIEQLPPPAQKAAVKAWAAVLEGIRSAQGPIGGEKP